MAAPRAREQQHHNPNEFLTYGLLFGPALGMLIALILFDGADIAIGLALGAALGVTIGVLLDAERLRRHGGR